MQNLGFGPECIFWGTEVVKHPFYSIGPKMMFGSVSEHFANVQHFKDAKLVFRSWCSISGYWSCKASFLLHWTQNVVWECFRAFRQPSARKKIQNLCFGSECTILSRSCKASTLLHWTQNDVWECFRAFRQPSARRRCKTCVSDLMHYFEVPKL
jgi:hypothetical protein